MLRFVVAALMALGMAGAAAAQVPETVAERIADTVHPAWESFEPEFRASVCPFSVPGGYSTDELQCGHVRVPEDRSAPESRLIRIFVMVIKSTSDQPALDPIVRLDGGPGGPSLTAGRVAAYRAPETATLRTAADLIFFDQRGVGYSDAPFCRGIGQPFQFGLQVEPNGNDVQRAAIERCFADAAQEGIAVEGYTNWQNALDVRDIRRALGVERWNVFGISYGTELGQAVMRVDPDGTRAIVLDSVVPVDMVTNDTSLLLANSFRSSLDALDAMCAADRGCAQAFENGAISSRFMLAFESYRGNPLVIEGLGEAVSRGGRLVIDESMAGDALFQAMYNSDVYASLPALLHALETRDETALRAYVEVLAPPLDLAYGWGMSEVINCRAGFREAPDAPPPPGPDGSGLLPYLSTVANYQACVAEIGTAPDPTVTSLQSDVPTLVVMGAADPITPPYFANMVMPGLSKGQRLDYPHTGHGALLTHFNTCGQHVIVEFFSDPLAQLSPDCISEIAAPDFLTDFRATSAPYHFARGLQQGQYPLGVIAAALFLAVSMLAFLVTPLARRIDATPSGNYGRARLIAWLGGALGLAGLAVAVTTIFGLLESHFATLPVGVPASIGLAGWLALGGVALCFIALVRAGQTRGGRGRSIGTLIALTGMAIASVWLLAFLFSIDAGPLLV